MRRSIIFLFAVMLGAIVQSCTDEGNPSAPRSSLPLITSVKPDSGAAGDTITVTGSNFGSGQSAGVLFIGDRKAEKIISWSSTEIRAEIPTGARSTSIIVTVNGISSNAQPYRIKGYVQGQLSFALDVQPIFLNNCALSGCHTPPSPTSNFNASTYVGLRAGGFTFGTAVIIPGDSSKSAVMQMVRSNNNLIGLRMPLGGPYKITGLPDSLIVTIGTWIVQGALNN